MMTNEEMKSALQWIRRYDAMLARWGEAAKQEGMPQDEDSHMILLPTLHSAFDVYVLARVNGAPEEEAVRAGELMVRALTLGIRQKIDATNAKYPPPGGAR